MDDLTTLSWHDLAELVRRRTQQRDALAAAIRKALHETRTSSSRSRWIFGVMMCVQALSDMERQDATADR